MKKLLELLNRNDLFCVWGMTTELGWTTKRSKLDGLKKCEDWLRNNPKNSLRLLFEDNTTLDFDL